MQVHGDDLGGTGDTGTLDRRDSDSPGAYDEHRRTWSHLGRVDCSTDTRGDTAADQRGDVERNVLVDADDRDSGEDGLLGKCATPGHCTDDLVAPAELR